MEVAPEEQGVPAPYQAPQARVPVLGRKVPIISGCENQQKLKLNRTEGSLSPRQFLLKSLHKELLGLTLSEPWLWEVSSKGTRDTQGGTKLSGIRERSGGSFIPDGSPGKGYCFFDEPSPYRACRWVPYLTLHQSGYHFCPALVIP